MAITGYTITTAATLSSPRSPPALSLAWSSAPWLTKPPSYAVFRADKRNRPQTSRLRAVFDQTIKLSRDRPLFTFH